MVLMSVPTRPHSSSDPAFVESLSLQPEYPCSWDLFAYLALFSRSLCLCLGCRLLARLLCFLQAMRSLWLEVMFRLAALWLRALYGGFSLSPLLCGGVRYWLSPLFSDPISEAHEGDARLAGRNDGVTGPSNGESLLDGAARELTEEK
jgi:hypothetical protein